MSPAGRGRSSLVALAFGNFAVGLGSLIIAGLIQPVAIDLTVSVAEVGQLVTVYAIAYALGSPALTLAGAAWPRRNVLVAGLALMVLGNMLGAWEPTYGWMAFARVVLALGAGLFTPTATSVAAVLSTPETRARAISLVFGGFTVATAIGVPLGTFVGANIGWRVTLGVVAALSLVAGVWVWRATPATVAVPRANLAVWRQVLGRGPLVMALLVTVLQLTAQFAVFTYLAPSMQAHLGLEPSGGQYLLLGLTFGAAGIAGNFIGGTSAERIGARRTVLWMLATLALIFAGWSWMLGVGSYWLALALTSLWGLSGLGFNAPQQIRLVGLAPALQGATLALNASALYVGTALGAGLGGSLVNATGGFLDLGWAGAALGLAARAEESLKANAVAAL